MAMSKAQREVLESILKRAEQGPNLSGPGLRGDVAQACEQLAGLWAQTWVAGPLRAVLQNDAGEIDARTMRYQAI